MNNYSFKRAPNLFFIGKIGLALMNQKFTQYGTQTNYDPFGISKGTTNIAINTTSNHLMLFNDLGIGYNLTHNLAITSDLQLTYGSMGNMWKLLTFPWGHLDASGLPAYSLLAGLRYQF